MRIKLLLPIVVLLGGCAAIEGNQSAPVIPVEDNSQTPQLVESDSLCLVDEDAANFEHQCDLLYWVNLWVQADNTRWPVRKQAIADLGEGIDDKIKKVILSLPTDTPYQSRLRAQHWLEEIVSELTPEMQAVVKTIVDAPNSEMLELESALVILNRVNTDKEKQIKMLEEDLEVQTKKMDELLKVEATLMDKNRSTQR
ncbi:hypothetical protein [Alteromonas confluentis]|uniref:Two-component system QseEF-associated lipoprotein QseG n=1 Tax=Alteromonas confluentis TaxID=1656094 RepID=A0A1E7Z7C6_9ALTE|nr:hypothetical protein [Alteromonas confluentis]OFC69438.1 hypothetical protein BFC18_18720 [Alteromonas confluentis]